MTDDETTAPTSAAEPKKDRKKPERKPLWVCIPKDPSDPAIFKVVKCATKADVGKVLTENGVDATNQEGVMILRARPIFPKIKQVMFRF